MMKKLAILATAAVITFASNKSYCFLSKIYVTCHDAAVKTGILKDNKKCIDKASAAAADIYQKYIAPNTQYSDKAKMEVGKIIALVCYSGCMDKKEIGEKLSQKCKNSK